MERLWLWGIYQKYLYHTQHIGFCFVNNLLEWSWQSHPKLQYKHNYHNRFDNIKTTWHQFDLVLLKSVTRRLKIIYYYLYIIYLQICNLPVGPKSQTVNQHYTNIWLMCHAYWGSQVNTINWPNVFAQCWIIVCNAGPTLSQHWAGVFCGTEDFKSNKITLNLIE